MRNIFSNKCETLTSKRTPFILGKMLGTISTRGILSFKLEFVQQQLMQGCIQDIFVAARSQTWFMSE